jgi:DNA-binding XRE family transcriptional regulator
MMDLDIKELGKMLENARKTTKKDGKKISREDVGKFVGVNQQTVYEWERGNSQPGFIYVVKFCDFLGISLDDLLGVKKNGCYA